MQVLLAQVQNSEQLLRTLQGTVSQAQERVQRQMVSAGPGVKGRVRTTRGPQRAWKGRILVLLPKLLSLGE